MTDWLEIEVVIGLTVDVSNDINSVVVPSGVCLSLVSAESECVEVIFTTCASLGVGM